MKNCKYIHLLIMLTTTLFVTTSYSYIIRNTYTSSLICVQVEKPHSRYIIASQSSSKEFKTEGKFNCQTKDKLYTSVCSVSEFQPIATFNTNDGSASCTTPARHSAK